MYAVIVRISQYGMFRRLTLFPSSSISSEHTRNTIPVLRIFRSPWNSIFLENVIVADLIKNFYLFCVETVGSMLSKISTVS